ncbi:hypothetical protein LEL_08046 [Akanthomyces lecanii RCEF 1005]|uniref:Uncharacterized protein n=1 Tax=Akanthomyces lecanii RCEF 1005 TaxID=1081108 RepID=A0A168EZV1_CORDF|nr:hypothetical protein LEL_08046 [Akanthomyces lecanii RCEF 1005]
MEFLTAFLFLFTIATTVSLCFFLLQSGLTGLYIISITNLCGSVSLNIFECFYTEALERERARALAAEAERAGAVGRERGPAVAEEERARVVAEEVNSKAVAEQDRARALAEEERAIALAEEESVRVLHAESVALPPYSDGEARNTSEGGKAAHAPL